MAEDQSTNDDQDTLVSEEVDTSTNDEVQDTDSDDEPSLEEASQDETDEPEESEENTEEADTEPQDSEDQSEEDDNNQQQSEDISDEERKRRNDEYARRRIAEREQATQDREKALQESQQRYLEGAEDREQESLRMLEIESYNLRVDTNATRLKSDIDKALSNIDLFKNGTQEEKEELANAVDEFERYNVQYDEYGNPIKVNGDLFQHLQNKARSIERLTSVGARKNLKQKQSAKSRTMSTPTRAPKEGKKDPDLAAFDEEANKW